MINKVKPEAFFISEAEVSDLTAPWLKVAGYDLILPDLLPPDNVRLVCYLIEGSSLRPLKLDDNRVQHVTLEDGTRRIVGLYRPFKLPNGLTKAETDKAFFELLHSAANTALDLWIGGDFNVNLQKHSSEKIRLQEWQDDHALLQLVKSSTWSRVVTTPSGVQQLRKSLLDHIYTNSELSTVTIDDKWSSDHNLLILDLPGKQRIVRMKTTTRCWRNYSKEGIRQCVNELVTEPYPTDASELDVYITNILNITMNKICPLRVIRTARAEDLVSDEVERIKKKRKRKMALFNKTRDEYLLSEIKRLDKKLKQKINTVRRNLVRSKMRSNNQKSFWNTVKDLQGNSSVGRQNGMSLIIDGVLTSKEEEISESFAAFFSNKVKNLSSDLGPYQWVRSKEFVTVTEEELNAAIGLLKNKMCCGHDGIPMKILKDAAPSLTKPLLDLMNLACKGIPDSWKRSIIVPLHKAKDRTNVANYRPISNLVSVSKLFEKIILAKLDSGYPNIEGQHQHGFRRGRGTHTALLEIQNVISSALDANKCTTVYSIDMTAAFDLL